MTNDQTVEELKRSIAKDAERIEAEVAMAMQEIQKFLTGNQTAGTRGRGHLQEVKKIAHTLRLNIQTAKNKGK